MTINKNLAMRYFCTVIILLAPGSAAWASPIAPTVTISDNQGMFLSHLYELTVSAGDLEVLGVIVENAFSLFALGPASPIAAPDNWSFSPPLGPDAEGLFYSSNTSDANINKGKSLAGFTFESTEKLQPFKVGLVTIGDGIKLVAVSTPEPATVLLVACGLIALLLGSVGRKRGPHARF
jgi:hypothetical protein